MLHKKLPKDLKRELQGAMNELLDDFSDCSICGLCCKDELLTISRMDANRISRKLGIGKEKFYEKYTHYNKDTFETVMNMPCPFLKENRCTIYEFRPKVCRNYPLCVMDDGVVIIQDVEACAMATHFNEVFLDFCKNNLPDFHKQIMDQMEESSEPSNDEPIKRVMYSANAIALFLQSLVGKKN